MFHAKSLNPLHWRAESAPDFTATITDARGVPFAVMLRADALRLSPVIITAAARTAPNLIAWSGSLADDPAERDPRTWGPSGLAALRDSLAHWHEPLRRANARLLLRPHARHVLCDPQRCVTLLNEWEKNGDPFGLVLDPAAMIEESMYANAEDHFRRACEALGHRAAIVIPSPCDCVPLELFEHVVRECVPVATPRVTVV